MPPFGLRGQDAWRRHPIFSWGWKEALPGIREGTGAFVLYLIYDAIAHRKAPAAHHGGGEHGEAAHHAEGHGAAAAAPAAHH